MYDQLGEQARAAGIEYLYGIGAAERAAAAFGKGGRGFNDRDRMLEALRKVLEEGDRVLIKGSRRAGMEQVIQALATGGVS